MGKFRDIVAKVRRPKGLGGDIRSVFSMTYSVHNRVSSKYKWYDNWHHKPYASKVHLSALGLCLVIFSSTVALAVSQVVSIPQNKTMIEAEAPNVSLAGKETSGSFRAGSGEKEVLEKREENFKTFDQGGGKYRLAGTVGPIHYKKDPFSATEQFKEIKLNILPHQKSVSEDWDYSVEDNGYQVRIWNTRSVGEENIKYVAQFRRADKFLEMAPSELIWENSKGDREIISLPKIAEPPIIDNTNYTVTWKNVFGDGIDFRYNISPDKFFKTVIVNNKESLPEPTIDKNGLKLTVVMGLNWDETVDPSNNFAKETNIDEIDATGETQDLQKSQDNPEKVLTKDELNSVSEEIKSSDPFSFKDDQGREVWWMGKPKAWDSAEDKHFFDLTQGFRRIDTKVFNDLSLRGDQVFAEDTRYPLYIDTNVPQEAVGASLDDVRRCYSNDLFQTNDWMVIGDSGVGYDKENSGMRFQTVPIAQNANIYNATLSLYGYPNAQGADANVKVKVRAQAADNPGAFSTQADWDTRFPGALTTAAVAWDGFPAWSASVAYPSPNISSVIQELVNRAGWASNNSMVLFVDDYDNRSSVGSRRVAYSYDNSATYAPILNISYYTPGTLNLAGICKQSDRTTNCANSVVVKVAVNGTLQAQTGSTLTGAWSITGVTANSGDVITVFKDNVADANEAVSVIKLGTGDLTDVALYERHLTLGATLGGIITNTDISNYDNSVSADEDIFVEVDASGNLTLPATGTSDATVNRVLCVIAANTYRPNSSGGKTITTDALFVMTGATLTLDSNTMNLVAATTPLVNSGTINSDTSTINYVCSTGAVNITIGTYYNLGVGTVSDTAAARTYTLAAGTTTVGNQITVGHASSTNTDVFAIGARTLELTGSGASIWNVTAKGSVTNGNSTVNYNGSSATTIRAMTYYNLGIGTTVDTAAGVTYTLGGDTTVSVLVTVGNASSTNSDIFALSNKNLIVTRSTNAPFTITAKGTFQADTSTVKYQGDAAMAVSNLAYYNLNLDPPSITAARAYTIAANALAISNNLTINATASTAYALTITLGAATTVTGTTSIAGTTLGTTVLDTKPANNYAFTTGVLTISAGGELRGNSSAITVNGNLTNAGRFGVLSGTTTIVGNLTNSGVFSQAGTTSLTVQNNAAATITLGSSVLTNLTINASGSTYTLHEKPRQMQQLIRMLNMPVECMFILVLVQVQC
ncbi:MAG: hypothetical protein WCG99_02785 [Candidatus Berkelbacteria bacterium]